MSKKENKGKLKWYNDAHLIVDLIMVSILMIIICSQSFANSGGSSLELFSSVINHNSIYLFILIYFVLLCFSFGKKYFNYLNVFLNFVYFIVTVTSLLTVIQSFTLATVLTFVLNFVLFIYLSHTFFRDSRIWKEFHLSKSPFNELTNDWYFYTIIVLSVFLLAVNLISTVVVSGVVLSVLDTIYFLLFGRFIFLYRDYLDSKKLDVEHEGNFDKAREKIKDVLDQTEIDDVIIDGAKSIKKKIDRITDKEEGEEKPAPKKRTRKTSSREKKEGE